MRAPGVVEVTLEHEAAKPRADRATLVTMGIDFVARGADLED